MKEKSLIAFAYALIAAVVAAVGIWVVNVFSEGNTDYLLSKMTRGEIQISEKWGILAGFFWVYILLRLLLWERVQNLILAYKEKSSGGWTEEMIVILWLAINGVGFVLGFFLGLVGTVIVAIFLNLGFFLGMMGRIAAREPETTIERLKNFLYEVLTNNILEGVSACVYATVIGVILGFGYVFLGGRAIPTISSP